MNPFIKINQIKENLSITYPTAKKAVQNLIKLEILSPIGNSGRNKLFVAHEILNVVIM